MSILHNAIQCPFHPIHIESATVHFLVRLRPSWNGSDNLRDVRHVLTNQFGPGEFLVAQIVFECCGQCCRIDLCNVTVKEDAGFGLTLLCYIRCFGYNLEPCWERIGNQIESKSWYTWMINRTLLPPCTRSVTSYAKIRWGLWSFGLFWWYVMISSISVVLKKVKYMRNLSMILSGVFLKNYTHILKSL